MRRVCSRACMLAPVLAAAGESSGTHVMWYVVDTAGLDGFNA